MAVIDTLRKDTYREFHADSLAEPEAFWAREASLID